MGEVADNSITKGQSKVFGHGQTHGLIHPGGCEAAYGEQRLGRKP